MYFWVTGDPGDDGSFLGGRLSNIRVRNLLLKRLLEGSWVMRHELSSAVQIESQWATGRTLDHGTSLVANCLIVANCR